MASKTNAAKSTVINTNAVDPIPTPTYPTNGLWTILTTTTIEAPLSTVLEVSLNASTWPEWNIFIPKVSILSQPDSTSSERLQVGTKVTFHSRMKKDGPTSGSFSDHEIVFIEKIERDGFPGWSIVWKTIGIPGGEWTLRAERVQELVEKRQNTGKVVTEYKTWGTFGGPMAYLLSWTGTTSDIVDRFGDWAEGLKVYCESIDTGKK